MKVPTIVNIHFCSRHFINFSELGYYLSESNLLYVCYITHIIHVVLAELGGD